MTTGNEDWLGVIRHKLTHGYYGERGNDDVRALLAEVERLTKALGDGASKVEALKALVRSGFPVPPIWEEIDAVAADLRRAAGEGGGR
ncbi:MAG: hypothetical protein MUF34_30770 [Polyangiaceae bacterium]|jgi:hypothetical protein|nr:hypothetical protein [Polyangiaceae bacterium]